MSSTWNLTVKFALIQGEDWNKILTLKDSSGNPKDIDGYTIRMCFALGWNDPIILDYSTTGSGITILNPTSAGKFEILIPKADIAFLGYPWNGVYDLSYKDDEGNPKKLVSGVVEVEPTLSQL
jgi:hypothetical protein